ncbi:MAG TPA: copper homeostasis protein CutE, partial [Halanaerobiales bacterium]|nr:copper homeostasis protein CutE [Halanaerobiales bacterium]
MILFILSLSAILITLPFYFPDLFFLSYFSFIPIFVIIKKSNIKNTFLYGWLFGFIYISISSYWLFYP